MGNERESFWLRIEEIQKPKNTTFTKPVEETQKELGSLKDQLVP